MAQPMRVLQHQQLSPEAEQFAGAYGLGRAQTEYKVGIKKSMLVWIVLGIILGGIFAAMTFSYTDPSAKIVFILVALLFFGIAVYGALTPTIYRSWRVYVCTNGFISKRGSKVEVFPWEQIESMWQAVTKHYTNGIYTGTSHKYTVRRKDGVKVIFNDKFARVEEMGNTLSRAITNYLLPQVISAYNAGNTITFGPLSISMQGVSNGRELLPWGQVKEMGVNRGVVTVKKEGKWLSWSTIRAATVPNLFVFMALVNYVLKQQRPA